MVCPWVPYHRVVPHRPLLSRSCKFRALLDLQPDSIHFMNFSGLAAYPYAAGCTAGLVIDGQTLSA
jgi:hypothetical protein